MCIYRVNPEYIGLRVNPIYRVRVNPRVNPIYRVNPEYIGLRVNPIYSGLTQSISG